MHAMHATAHMRRPMKPASSEGRNAPHVRSPFSPSQRLSIGTRTQMTCAWSDAGFRPLLVALSAIKVGCLKPLVRHGFRWYPAPDVPASGGSRTSPDASTLIAVHPGLALAEMRTMHKGWSVKPQGSERVTVLVWRASARRVCVLRAPGARRVRRRRVRPGSPRIHGRGTHKRVKLLTFL